jgi:hypothetical protein
MRPHGDWLDARAYAAGIDALAECIPWSSLLDSDSDSDRLEHSVVEARKNRPQGPAVHRLRVLFTAAVSLAGLRGR